MERSQDDNWQMVILQEEEGVFCRIESSDFKKGFVDSNGNYEVLFEIGQGAQGITFLVKDKALDERKVVVKMTANTFLESKAPLNMFRAEGPSVPQIYSSLLVRYKTKESEFSHYLTVMEYAGNKNLSDFYQENPDLSTQVRIFRQIAQVLQRVHSKGYVHCDIKAENIHVENERAFVLDWGGLKEIGEDLYVYTHLDDNYNASKKATVAHDLYSLATTWEELFAKRGFPSPLQKLIEACKDPESLYLKDYNHKEPGQVAQRVVDDLQAYLEKKPMRVFNPWHRKLLSFAIQQRTKLKVLSLGIVTLITLYISLFAASYLFLENSIKKALKASFVNSSDKWEYAQEKAQELARFEVFSNYTQYLLDLSSLHHWLSKNSKALVSEENVFSWQEIIRPCQYKSIVHFLQNIPKEVLSDNVKLLLLLALVEKSEELKTVDWPIPNQEEQTWQIQAQHAMVFHPQLINWQKLLNLVLRKAKKEQLSTIDRQIVGQLFFYAHNHYRSDLYYQFLETRLLETKFADRSIFLREIMFRNYCKIVEHKEIPLSLKIAQSLCLKLLDDDFSSLAEKTMINLSKAKHKAKERAFLSEELAKTKRTFPYDYDNYEELESKLK